MSYASWHVGMEVVCIKREPWVLVDGPLEARPLPQYGEICTIAGLDVHQDQFFVALTEYGGGYFLAQYFRPVQKRKADISIFTALLNTTKEREPA
jgi:hypothetical protein